MPQNEWNELHAQLNAASKSLAALKPYQQSVDALYEQVKALYGTDRHGLSKLVDADTLKTLREAYRACAESSAQYLALVSEKQPEAQLVRRMDALLSRDLDVLGRYDAQLQSGGEQESLPTLIENARGFTVDLTQAQIQTVGAQMSERIPLELTVNGRQMRGMFTKAKRLNYLDAYRKEIDRAASDCPDKEGREAIRNLLGNFRAYFAEEKLDEQYDNFAIENDDEKDALTLALYLDDRKDEGELLKEILSYQKGFRKKPDTAASKCGEELIEGLTASLQKRLNAYYTVIYNSIEPNARLDDRNAAMSKTASLLGLSHVICNAIPMRCLDANGEVIEGTFMEMARGVDANRPDKALYGKFSEKEAFDRNKYVLRDLADLQALDYICGNTDRHAGNMIFTFDNGNPAQVTGVQGIDNDMSFGASTFEQGFSKLASLDEMRVIGESTARKVQALTPAQLKLALREFSLSETELDAAGRRLELLQKRIELGREHYQGKDAPKSAKDFEKGKLRVLSDEEFGALDLKMLEPEKPSGFGRLLRSGMNRVLNIFSYAISNLAILAENLGKRLSAPDAAKIASANRATKESAAMQNEKANDFADRVDDLLKTDKPVSVKPLHDAIKRYRKFQNELDARLNPQKNEDAQKTEDTQKGGDVAEDYFSGAIMPNDLTRMRDLLDELKRESEAYLQKNTKKSDPFRQLASDVAAFAQKLTNVPPELAEEERQTAMANERQATERFNRKLAGMAEKAASGAQGAAKEPSKTAAPVL